ncbi:MAG TPA: hypothetical protein ENK57_04990 [Polyangiaceae bacterium]|nr:hypothetical protein [Polyangiaceae bacterium]
MPAETQADVERQVADVARAMCQRGAIGEGVLLLRGALHRDPSQAEAEALLREILEGSAELPRGTMLELGLDLVDGWIRRGMLVEALAILGGTPLGSSERGGEWANLLGELLAPVPAAAEPVLVRMYEELVSGGASVALTLLEERARVTPSLPAWAGRRLGLLRWMLLDNAEAAPSISVLNGELGLGAALQTLQQRGLDAGLRALEVFVQRHPERADVARVCGATQELVEEIGRQASLLSKNNKTMPMTGHTAAMLQLRMGNLSVAATLYRPLAAHDELAAQQLRRVELLLCAVAGKPLPPPDSAAEDALDSEVTTLYRAPSDDGNGRATAAASITVIPTTEVSRPDGVLGGPTAVTPSAGQQAENLARAGRLEEAEQLYRGLLDLSPDDVLLRRRVEELRAARLGRSGVLIRAMIRCE